MWTEKDRILVARLLESSKAGKTEWLPTAYNDRFTTSVAGKYSFQIVRIFGGNPEFELRILDAGGETIHTLDSHDYAELVTLYEYARRTALKVDNTIDDILAELDKQQ